MVKILEDNWNDYVTIEYNKNSCYNSWGYI